MLEFVLQAAGLRISCSSPFRRRAARFCNQAVDGRVFCVDFLLPGERAPGDKIKTSCPNSLCILCIAFVSLLRYNVFEGGNSHV